MTPASDQPIKLLGLEIVSFPAHIKECGAPPYQASTYAVGGALTDQASTDIVKLPHTEHVSLIILGIDAVAVICDEGLFASAKLYHVGTGHVRAPLVCG